MKKILDNMKKLITKIHNAVQNYVEKRYLIESTIRKKHGKMNIRISEINKFLSSTGQLNIVLAYCIIHLRSKINVRPSPLIAGSSYEFNCGAYWLCG